MGFISRDEFLKMQAEREQNQQARQSQGPYVSFFSLRDDGDEAIVRFAYNDPAEFEVYTVHPVTIDGKFRKVNCINDLRAGVSSCPMCAAGVQLQQKFYIRLIEYTRDEQGNIVPQAKIWERPTSYMQILTNLFTEYGPLKDNVFKVKRSGARGDMQTTYSIMFGNPTIYNEQLYPKDFSAFENYSPLGTAILDKNDLELSALVAEMGLEINSVNVGVSDTTNYQQPQANQTFTPQTEYTPPKVGVDAPRPAYNPNAPRAAVKY